MKKWKILIFFSVFFLFLFLRLYNIDKRIIFDWDQQNFSYQIKNIIEKGKLTLIGPRANNDLGFFLGPYFTYLLLPLYWLTKLDPSALILFIILFNLSFFTITFKVLNKIFNYHFVILFLILWSINSLLVNYDTIPWWPIFIPLGTILVINTLFKITKKNDSMSWLFLGLLLGFFVNLHFQFVFVILFATIFLIISILQGLKIDWKKIFLLLFGFIILFSPLFLFDLRHQFLNSKLFLNFFTGSGNQLGKDYFSWILVFGNFIKPLVGINNDTVTILFLILTGIATVFLTYKEKGKFLKKLYLSILILWILVPIFFIYYGKRPSEYYYVFFYPLIYCVLINFIFSFKKITPYLFSVLVCFLIAINVEPVKGLLKDNNFGLFYKKKAIERIKIIGKGKKFNVSFDVPLGWNNGYDYLFDVYGVKQTGDWNDPLIQIRIPPKEKDIVINQMGLMIPDDL